MLQTSTLPSRFSPASPSYNRPPQSGGSPMRVRNSRSLVLLVPVIWACSTPPAPTAEKASEPADNVADVRKAIEDANTKFLDALSKGDATTASNNYADDAVLMMPNEAAMSGHQAIVDGFT